MQIDPRRAQSTPPAAPAPRARRPAPPPAASPPAASDSVSISPEARALAASRRAVEAAPEVREDRVAELKKRLASGDYHVPADTLARDLLNKDLG